MNIAVDILDKMSELFKYKNWEIESDAAKWSSLFNRFSSRLSLFDKEKQEFLIELSYRFKNIGINDYAQYFTEAVNNVPNIKEYKRIIVAPLKKPSTKETKSADNIWYHLKNNIDFNYEWFNNNLQWISNWDKIRQKLNENCILLLVDDFTGTGDTAIEALDELYETKQLDSTDNVCVITFMGQRIGIENFSVKYPNMMSCSEILDREISDHYAGEEKKKYLLLMEEMESKIKVDPKFNFGWGKSESLVALNNRSVNNTFPVFWLEKKSKYAPFKR
ncbi:hypothetical protein [Pedobacter sp. SYSU D00535]|uniref:phosphoribosyltransferase-like protein n=1 Tax=Pedobacter sp. SYSU D00535 TaxID=2810308 RepID=UPI001A9715DB|nr:hypothetical protein [Pedobacter sp. SYSU D00535]